MSDQSLINRFKQKINKPDVQNTEQFLGCTITPLKEANDVYTKTNKEDIIVVSTCFFISSNFNIDNKTFKYIDELIANIESFQMKINRFTTNPTKWIYRVYIDDTIFKLKQIIDKKFQETNLANSNIKEINANIEKNKNKLLYIYLLLTTYIDEIIKSKIYKYIQIEIYTYSNDNIKYKLINNDKSNISGHIATFGTLIRYHPLTDSRIGYCIMRNCSTNFGPLDIMIQNYWINIKKTKYMEYKIFQYSFLNFKNMNTTNKYAIKYMKIYEKNINSSNNIRFGAGLISVKLNSNEFTNYITTFNSIKETYIDIKLNSNNNKYKNNKNKYEYGIDELFIKKIFPDLVSYMDVFSIELSSKPVNSNICDTIVNKNVITPTEKKNETKLLYCNLPKLLFGVKLFNTILTQSQITNEKQIKLSEGNINMINEDLEDIYELDTQYKDIYNYIGTKLLYNINTFPISELPEMAILKSFDYDIKYNFYFEKINNIMIRILINNLGSDSDSDTYYDKIFNVIKLDISNISDISDKKLLKTVKTYMDTLEIAFSLENFKPLIIYPKKFNLYTNDKNKSSNESSNISKKSITIHDLILDLPKHNLTFELENELEKLNTTTVSNNNIIVGGFNIKKSKNKIKKNIIKTQKKHRKRL